MSHFAVEHHNIVGWVGRFQNQSLSRGAKWLAIGMTVVILHHYLLNNFAQAVAFLGIPLLLGRNMADFCFGIAGSAPVLVFCRGVLYLKNRRTLATSTSAARH